MFNSVSRQELFSVIEKFFPELLPMAHLLFGDNGTFHHRWEDGNWKSIDMREELNQGCPFSAIFADMVLDRVLRPLNMELNERAADRRRATLQGTMVLGALLQSKHGLMTWQQ